jgi:hypothetical protein
MGHHDLNEPGRQDLADALGEPGTVAHEVVQHHRLHRDRSAVLSA